MGQNKLPTYLCCINQYLYMYIAVFSVMLQVYLNIVHTVPLAVESYEAWDPEASKAFSQVATRLAIHGNSPKAKIAAELYGHLSVLLVRANA